MLGILRNLMCKNDTAFYYHFTSSLDHINKKRSLYAGADGSIYLVANGENFKLGIGASPTGVVIIPAELLRGSVKKSPVSSLWGIFKRARGEYRLTAGFDLTFKSEQKISQVTFSGVTFNSITLNQINLKRPGGSASVFLAIRNQGVLCFERLFLFELAGFIYVGVVRNYRMLHYLTVIFVVTFVLLVAFSLTSFFFFARLGRFLRESRK